MAHLDLMQIYEKRDRARLRSASAEEVRVSLVALCDRFETKPGDFDRLTGVGRFLSSVGHDEADATVIDWFCRRPTSERLDVASALLDGLWMQPPHPASAERVAKLVRARPTMRVLPDAEYAYAQAMGRVIDDDRTSPEAFQMAVQSLQEVVARGTGDGSCDELLAKWGPAQIDRALERRGAAFHASLVGDHAPKTIVIERTATRSEVVRVTRLDRNDRSLTVAYEILDLALTEQAARRLIYHRVLVGLLRDAHRGQVDTVRYICQGGAEPTVAPYGPP